MDKVELCTWQIFPVSGVQSSSENDNREVGLRLGISKNTVLAIAQSRLGLSAQRSCRVTTPAYSRHTIYRHFYQSKQQLGLKNAGFRRNPGRPSCA